MFSIVCLNSCMYIFSPNSENEKECYGFTFSSPKSPIHGLDMQSDKCWAAMCTTHRKMGKGVWKLECLRKSPKPPGFGSQWFSVTFIIIVWLDLNCWGNVGLSNHGLCGSLWLNLTWLIQAQLRFKTGQWARNYITGKRPFSVARKVVLKVGKALVCRIFRHLWVVQT